jgi:DNA repair protein RadA/Sms
VVATLEGTRPILLELQALVSPTGAAVPRRVANGLDSQRVAMLLAVLEKRLGIRLATADVFLNVVGGLEIREPAADLGVTAAVLSSERNVSVDPSWAFFGEVGLGGEVRGVPQVEKRLQELARLGFARAILPRAALESLSGDPPLQTVGLSHVGGLADILADR